MLSVHKQGMDLRRLRTFVVVAEQGTSLQRSKDTAYYAARPLPPAAGFAS